ncbi:MAG: hypothetical protein KBG28_02345 [Kofleriaceae bacterium]|nr:hypothetical protein [Kofleriaceae bacterium]
MSTMLRTTALSTMLRTTALSTLLLGGLGCVDNTTPPGQPPPSAAVGCVPDRDGVITAAELPVATDVALAYYTSPAGATRTIDLAVAGDPPRWDLSSEEPDDERVDLVATPLGAQWYADQFPGGQFVAAAGPGLDAIYHKDDAALWLHGTASTEPMPASGRTLVRYTSPVPALRLPLTVGDVDQTVAAISDGVVLGLPFLGEDRYAVEVVAAGRLDLPYVRFSPALLVRTQVVRAASSGGATTSRRSASFLFECFGEITRADSQPDEPAADFTVAASLRRLAL